ncbi:tetratricopeptide repeat protein [Sporosarcina sp. G11-34]|uniref:tetratricopeptide repeat protein n=1 Tax=Sporosarcina sp. G11-34 TaxID=2849605 RepID=UPI0022A9327D|nr:tetratricopeptide repeat protein [Sporosarcina sp. G11-34]MCZ2257400.1 tetratricopeptide repeat protein [Sporosarcina sp. G11-34]
MNVGHLIRAERIRQEMKQVVLAKAICTPSYLSKIERNLICPSEQVTTLLFNKLGIDIDMLQKSDQETEIEFLKLLNENYKAVITTRDDNFTKQKLEYVIQQSSLFENDSLYYTYLLIVLRFQLILGEDLEVRKKEIDDLDKASANFNTMQIYLFKVNKALYYYAIKNRKKAIEYFEDVILAVNTITLEDWEKAELNYMLGLAYTADNRVFISIEYIRKALDFFKENFQMKRVLDCYVLIGVTHKKSEQFQEALECYLKAQQICIEFNLHGHKGIIYHNLGSLYSITEKTEEAIHYFNKSIEYKTDKQSKLISVLNLVVEYSKMNNKSLVSVWCDKGTALLLQLNDENLTSYYHHFKFYKSIHSKQGLSETIAEQAIEHFKSLQDYQHVHKYYIALADWYFSNRKYKQSSICYKEANRYGYTYRKIEKWEDL